MASRLIALAAAGLIVAMAACVTEPRSQEAAAPNEPANSCYWLSNQGEGWVARPDLDTEALCFEMDSCDGGLGGSGGGCYKWSTGPDAPARPWSSRMKPR